MIRIKSKRHLFRRCGIAHPAEWVEHADNYFTPEQMEILKAETMLIVEEVPEEEKVSGGAGEIYPPPAGSELGDDEPAEDVDLGEVAEEAPPEIPAIETAIKPVEELTVRELIALCEQHEPPIQVPKKARKAELIKLLE